MKVCYKCKVENPLSEFGKKSGRKDGHQSMCKLCMKERGRQYYRENKEYYKDKSKAHKTVIREYLNEVKKNSVCACGENRLPTLQFHHKNPLEKDFNLGYAVTMGWSLDKVKQEVDKCVVICANCHFCLHAEE